MRFPGPRSVSEKTDVAVAGEEAGGRLEKATTLGFTLVDEARLLEMLGG